MRKLKWLFVLAAILSLGFIRKIETESKISHADAPIPGNPSIQAVAGADKVKSQDDHAETLDTAFEEVAGIASKALASKAEKDRLRQRLGDANLQLQVLAVLAADDSSSFDVEHEKRRMQATAFLGLIFQDPSIKGRDQVIRMAAERVLTVNFKSMINVRQKQSILGDVVEIMQGLKRFDPETFQSLANTIEPSNKALQHALKVAG